MATVGVNDYYDGLTAHACLLANLVIISKYYLLNYSYTNKPQYIECESRISQLVAVVKIILLQ